MRGMTWMVTKKRRIIVAILVTIIMFITISVSVNAANDNEMFDPKQTNKLYDGLVEGTSNIEDLQNIEYDNSLLWAVEDWSRAWLVTSLFSDLRDNDIQIYDMFAPTAAKFYVALIPPMFDSSYSYYVLAIDGTDALNFTYTPGSTACSYSVLSGITQNNIDNLSLLAVKVWEVTESDFDDLNKIIENTDKTPASKNDGNNTKAITVAFIGILVVGIIGLTSYKKKRANKITQQLISPQISNQEEGPNFYKNNEENKNEEEV